MLSILIPTYNYNTLLLVVELKKQADLLEVEYEILVQDDAGTSFIDENSKINKLNNCFFFVNETNLGRGNNINSLVEKSKFNYVLILDCDVFPKNSSFISNYYNEIRKEHSIIFGGICYEDKIPSKNKILRYTYGKHREQTSVKNRLKNPSQFLTSNIVLNKNKIPEPFFDQSITSYGYEDLVFSKKMEQLLIPVKHIENEVYHLNLEISEVYLKKTQTALKNLKNLIDKGVLNKNATKISKVYFLLKKLNLSFFLKVTKFLFYKSLKRNILSNKPIILFFDLYKLIYFKSLFD